MNLELENDDRDNNNDEQIILEEDEEELGDKKVGKKTKTPLSWEFTFIGTERMNDRRLLLMLLLRRRPSSSVLHLFIGGSGEILQQDRKRVSAGQLHSIILQSRNIL